MNNIPRDWQIKKLKDTTQRIIVGLATSVTKYYRYKGIPIIRNLNIRDGYFDSHSILYLDEEFANKEHRKSVNYNDILVVHTGVNLGLACLVPLDFHGAQTFTTLIITTKSQELFPSYLMYYINSENGKSEIERLQVGAGKNNLNVKDFNNFIILIPPLSEQKKIASILSTIDNLIQNIDYLINSYTLLKKGLMQTLLTKGICHTEFKDSVFGKIPKEWKITTLGEIAEEKKNAIVDGPFGTQLHADEYISDGIPVIRVINLSYKGKFLENDLVYISENKAKTLSRSKIVPDDLIIAKTGATIGKSGIFPMSFTEGIIASSCLKITANKKVVNPFFLLYFISSEMSQNFIINYAGGSTRSTINIEPFKKIPFLLPALNEQDTISSILISADELIENYEYKYKLLHLLKKGLMQQLLTGKIRVKV